MKPFCLVALIVMTAGAPSAPPAKSDSALQSLKERMIQACSGFRGRIGFHLILLDEIRTMGFRDNERFPSASTIKTAVMVEAINQVEEGKLKWTDKMAVPTDPSRREASMWSYFLKDNTKLDLDGFVNLMIGVSDNTATIVTRDWLGTMNVNARMEALGLKDTKILGNAPKDRTDIQRLRRMFGMGMTTPKEIATLFRLIHERKAASPAGCEKMLRILGRQYWDDFIGSSVPPDVKTCLKSGAITRSRSDVGLVYGPKPYILSIYTDSQADKRWTSLNEGDVIIKKLAGMVWNAINPGRPYHTPEGSDRFAPTGGGVE